MRRQRGQFCVQDLAQLPPGDIVRSGIGRGRRGEDFHFPPAEVARPRLEGHAAGDAMQPAGQLLATSDRGSPVGQNQERSLKGVLGVLRVAEYGPADTQDHRPMTLHQGGEGRFVALVEVALEQVGVRQHGLAADSQTVEETEEGGGADWGMASSSVGRSSSY